MHSGIVIHLGSYFLSLLLGRLGVDAKNIGSVSC